MPLKEQDRQRLDSIVSQMEASGESPDNINAVVGDFKSKYGADGQSTAMGATADNVSRALLNGMTFGFGDNLEAAIGALPVLGDKKPNEAYGQAYDRNLAEIRNKMQSFQQQNPVANGALDLAGGMIPAALTGGTATGFLKALTGRQALPLAARVAEGAAVGAGYGALGAAGNSNADNTPDLLRAAGSGAVVGGITGGTIPVVSAGMRSVGGSLAEAALGISKRDRSYGKTPGAAILDETKGLTASSVEDSARKKMDELVKMMTAASQGKTVDLGAAQIQAQALADEARRGINAPLAEELQILADALKNAPQNFHGSSTAGVIDATQPAVDASRMKRDFSNRFLRWNSTASPSANSAGKQVYRTIDQSIDNAVPGAASINQRISSLIPVVQRAEDRQLQAGASQRVAHRIAAHTGAAAAAVGGGMAFGPLGAAAGMIIPELAVSTPAEMAAARLLNVPSQAPASLSNMLRYLLSQGGRAVPLR